MYVVKGVVNLPFFIIIVTAYCETDYRHLYKHTIASQKLKSKSIHLFDSHSQLYVITTHSLKHVLIYFYCFSLCNFFLIFSSISPIRFFEITLVFVAFWVSRQPLPNQLHFRSVDILE